MMLLVQVANGQLQTGESSAVSVPWWSFTKTVLAAVSLSLVRDGLVDLDDNVPGKPYTLRQLLRHEAGLADYGELADYHAAVARHDTPWSPAEMARRLDADRLRYAPGTDWRYSNVGYMQVALLIERVTGLALGQALTQRALKPLGLSHTRLAHVRADLDGVCMGSAPAYDPGWVYHGLLVGPLADAALFLDRLLDGHLLPETLLRHMQTVRRLGGPIPGRPWLAPGYGLGVMQGPVAGDLTLCGHTGGGPGSVVAVYHGARNGHRVTCAAFRGDGDQGAVEAEVVARLSATLGLHHA